MSDPQRRALSFLARVQHSSRDALDVVLDKPSGVTQSILDALYRRGLVSGVAVTYEQRAQRGREARTFAAYAITEKGRRRLARAEA